MIADNEVADYAAQAREFLSKSRTFLAAGDLHQASEKGWGAAAHMAKSVAVAQGWEYGNHADFSDMLYPESTDRWVRLAEAARRCSSESGIMVLQLKTDPRKGAPN